MMRIPEVVVHLKDVEIDEHARSSIERRCGQLAEEFHEVARFELSVAEDGTGYTVHGHAVGKHTDIATQAEASEVGPAADLVLDRIERQLRRVHDKRIFSQRREAQRDPPKRNVSGWEGRRA